VRNRASAFTRPVGGCPGGAREPLRVQGPLPVSVDRRLRPRRAEALICGARLARRVLYGVARPILFRVDPERAHEFAARRLEGLARSPRALKAVAALYRFEDPRLESQVWGLRFPNPVGLAAGFDKDARMAAAFPSLGFGFLEVGTVTSVAQPGNPKPRLFRLPEDRALLNRLGFNNAGADAAAQRLARAGRLPIPVGVNIGKAKVVPNEEAVKDYVTTLEKVFPHADFVVVNVSSPNTPGLRALQDRGPLLALLTALKARARDLASAARRQPPPILVKIAPDLEPEALADALDVARAADVSGLVATNTTLSREGLARAIEGPGGVSGAPLRERATAFVREAWRATGGAIPIVGVGGVFTARDAYEKIRAGASLVELYTGFIYGGPATAKRVNKGLADLLARDGFASVAEAVGADHA